VLLYTNITIQRSRARPPPCDLPHGGSSGGPYPCELELSTYYCSKEDDDELSVWSLPSLMETEGLVAEEGAEEEEEEEGNAPHIASGKSSRVTIMMVL